MLDLNQLQFQAGGAGDRQHDGPARADHDEPRVLPTRADAADLLAVHARPAQGDRGRAALGAEGVRRRRGAARRQEGRLAVRGRQEGARYLQVCRTGFYQQKNNTVETAYKVLSQRKSTLYADFT